MSTLAKDAPAERPKVLIPRHVEQLLQLARDAGLTVSPVAIEEDEGEDGLHWYRLVSSWSGPGPLFFSTGIFQPGQRRILESPTETNTYLGVPAGHHHYGYPRYLPVATGRAIGSAARMTWQIKLGLAPLSIEQIGAVEISRTPDTVTWHGKFGDLVAMGINPDRLPTRKRSYKRPAESYVSHHECGRPAHYEACHWWAARREAHGTFLYTEDTAEAFARRQAVMAEWTRRAADWTRLDCRRSGVHTAPKRPALQLVVDNTRTDPV